VDASIQQERERIMASWDALENVIKSCTEEQLTTLQKDRWTVQDHLAHIALAEQFVVAEVQGQPPLHEVVGTDQNTFLNSSDDELNEIAYQRDKSLGLKQVLERRALAHQALLDAVARLSDDDLNRPYAPYGNATEMTRLTILRGNTYEHYDAHRGWIEAMLAPTQ
jgi:hypothetical protein